jgi:hypothetical protein
MKRISRCLGFSMIAGLALATVMLFQNCNGYSAGYNPLYDTSAELISCQGINCAPDIADSQIQVGYTTGILQPPPVGYVQNPAVCDPYSCVDFGGYCDMGGMNGSVFYYQWQLNGSNFGGQIRTGYTCDTNGRFRVMVQIPSGYVSGQIYQVMITMTVIDATGIEQSNPRGTNMQLVSIQTAQ